MGRYPSPDDGQPQLAEPSHRVPMLRPAAGAEGAKGVQEGGGRRGGGTLAEMTTPFRLRSDSASDPNVVIVSRSTYFSRATCNAHSALRRPV